MALRLFLGLRLRHTDTAVVNLEDGTPIQIPNMSGRIVTLREVFEEIGISPSREQVFLSAMGRPNDHRRLDDFDILLGADDIVIVAPRDVADRMK